MDYDDVLSLAKYYFLTVARRFDPRYKVKLQTFCTHRVRGGVKDFLQHWEQRRFLEGVELADCAPPHIDGRDSVEDSALEQMEQRAERWKLAEAIRLLRKPERDVLRMHFIERRRECEIAAALRVSESTTRKIRRRAIAQLKAEVGAA